MQEIYLDTYHLHSLVTANLPTRVYPDVEGIDFPDTREDLYDRPGEHGRRLTHTFYGGRVIVLQGSIRGDSANYRGNRQAFEAACGLQLDSNNLPILRTLKFTDSVGGQYQVLVSTKKLTVKDEYPGYAKWLLQLTAPDYRIESQTLTTSTISLPQGGGVTFPITFPITFGASSGGSATLNNAGTAPALPTIVIAGPAINPVVTNQTTGERFALNLTLVSGDVLTIDCVNRTVLQGTTNRMGSKTTDSVFFALQPGDNLVSFAASAYDVGTATVSYRSAHIGL